MNDTQTTEQVVPPSSQKKSACVGDIISSLDGVTPTFVLVDPMLGDPLPGIESQMSAAETQAAREACWDREVTQILLSDRTALPVTKHPYLISTRGPDDSVIELTLELAQAEKDKAYASGLDGQGIAAHRIGGWLQSTMHAHEIADAIAVMCTVNTKAFTHATYLRLADRRTLALLNYVIGNTRIRGMLGRIQRWSYLDALGSISTLNGMQDGENADQLCLDHAEWARMQRGELINRSIAQWLGEQSRSGCDYRTPTIAADLYPGLDNAVDAAQHALKQWPHRFNDIQDQTTFAALTLLHPGLFNSMEIIAFLADKGTSDEPSDPMRYLVATLRQRQQLKI